MAENNKGDQAKTPKTEAKATAGKAHFDAGGNRVYFQDSTHGALAEAEREYNAAVKALGEAEAIKAADSKFAAAIAELKKTHAAAHPENNIEQVFKTANMAALDDASALLHPNLDKDLMAKIEAKLAEHAPKEFEAVKTAGKKHLQVVGEIMEAESAALKAMTPEQLKTLGASEQALKQFHERAAAIKSHTQKAEGFVDRLFHNVKTHGFGGALDRHLGGEAWKTNTVQTGFRAAAIALGVILVGRGLFKGEKKADDGTMKDRPITIRAIETVGGGALIGAAALAGGR